MDPQLDKAFIKAIRAYFEDLEPEESNKAAPNRKYNKKYFDSVEEEQFGKKYPKTKKDHRPKEEVKEGSNANR